MMSRVSGGVVAPPSLGRIVQDEVVVHDLVWVVIVVRYDTR